MPNNYSSAQREMAAAEADFLDYWRVVFGEHDTCQATIRLLQEDRQRYRQALAALVELRHRPGSWAVESEAYDRAARLLGGVS